MDSQCRWTLLCFLLLSKNNVFVFGQNVAPVGPQQALYLREPVVDYPLTSGVPASQQKNNNFLPNYPQGVQDLPPNKPVVNECQRPPVYQETNLPVQDIVRPFPYFPNSQNVGGIPRNLLPPPTLFGPTFLPLLSPQNVPLPLLPNNLPPSQVPITPGQQDPAFIVNELSGQSCITPPGSTNVQSPINTFSPVPDHPFYPQGPLCNSNQAYPLCVDTPNNSPIQESACIVNPQNRVSQGTFCSSPNVSPSLAINIPSNNLQMPFIGPLSPLQPNLPINYSPLELVNQNGQGFPLEYIPQNFPDQSCQNINTEDISIISAASTSSESCEQTDKTEEVSKPVPINLFINIPKQVIPAPKITIINPPPPVPETVAETADNIDILPPYPLPPIIIERGRSRNRSWLPLFIVALFAGDGGYGGGCGSCCSNSNSGGSLFVPYPIAIPTSNPIIMS